MERVIAWVASAADRVSMVDNVRKLTALLFSVSVVMIFMLSFQANDISAANQKNVDLKENIGKMSVELDKMVSVVDLLQKKVKDLDENY